MASPAVLLPADDVAGAVPAPRTPLERLWARIHPTPDLPLTEPFTAGLGPLLDAMVGVAGGVLDTAQTRKVIDLVGDRYTVTVSPLAVTSRGLLRRRRVVWGEVEAVVVEPMVSMAVRRVVGRTSQRALGRATPIPGLGWVAGKVVGHVTDAAGDLAARTLDNLPSVVVEVRARRGTGLVLEGPLGLTSLLSRGLTQAIVAEAARRQVPILEET